MHATLAELWCLAYQAWACGRHVGPCPCNEEHWVEVGSNISAA